MWEVTNKVLNRQKGPKDTLEKMIFNGKTYTEKAEIANQFNKHFAGMGRKLAKKFKKNSNFTKYIKKRGKESFDFFEIDENDIKILIYKMKSKTSSSFDGFSNKILKKIIHTIAKPIAILVNRSQKDGICPARMKLAKVVPLHKGGDKLDPSNYRPISLLSVFSKIYEKVVFRQLADYAEKHIICAQQFGFRKGSETSHCIQNFFNNLNNKIRDKYHVALLLDIRKAFDTVNHEILLDKLALYGVQGNAIKWFKSYLTGRAQKVNIDDAISNEEILDSGVPQGSILGPLLFLIYISDLPAATELLTSLFADDSTFQQSAKTLAELESKLQTEVNKVSDWFEANHLTVHPEKTKYILFKSKKKEVLNITLSGHKIEKIGRHEKEKSIKFLGLHLDEDLKWKEHQIKIVKKLQKTIYPLSKLKSFLSLGHKKQIYIGLLKPIIEYGIMFWGNSTCSLLNKTYKKTIRILAGRGRVSHTEPTLKMLGILKLHDIFKARTLAHVSKVKRGMVSEILQSTYNWQDREHRKWFQIRSNLHIRSIQWNLPQRAHVEVWNNTLSETEVIAFEKMTHKGFIKRWQKAQITSYNSSCTRKDCYSCEQQTNRQHQSNISPPNGSTNTRGE